jgi:amino acid transporter/nucleotide-binding universal stress UspA family protein
MADEELAKDLGPLAALTIGVGTMIGAGIFVLPRQAYQIAGPAIALSFVVGGVISLFTALSASELGTAMPKAGGSYYYVNHALGPLFGSIAGMGNWMGLAFASAFYMIGFGDFVTALVAVPAIDLNVIRISGTQVAAFFAGILFIGINYVGAKETGRLQNVIVITLVAILTVFSILGFLQADLSTLKPFAPTKAGYGAVLPGTALVFVSFLGFAKITTVAEEIKNPGRNLPLAVVGSVVIVTTMYAILMIVMASVINWTELAAPGADPVVEVAEVAFGNSLGLAGVGAGLIIFGGLLATASSANASILASSRINFAMGRDKLITAWLNDIHDKFATPYRSIAVTGVIILVLILIGNIKILAKAGSVLHLIVYGLLNLALIVMREADVAEYDPAFRVPLYPITPILGALFSFALIAFMAPIEIALAILFVVVGISWFFIYARPRTEKQGVLSKYVLSRPDNMPEPAVSAATSVKPDGGDYRVMVPLANPEHETDLISLASAVASQRGGTVVATHIVQVPDQTPLASGAEHVEELDAESADLLERARSDAETFGVPVETHTILSHRSFEEIFDAAQSHDADLVVMGWGEDSHGSPGRAESALDELTNGLPCDVVVLRDRGFDPSRVLVPTAGGPDSALSAAIAQMLRAEYDAELTLLHVTDESREAGEEFLADWAAEHDITGANLVVEVGDVETAIERAAADCSLLVIGATEEGLLARLFRGSLALDIVDDVDCSVLLAEKQRKRSVRERLLG